MRLIDYVSEPRWCGRCGEPVRAMEDARRI